MRTSLMTAALLAAPIAVAAAGETLDLADKTTRINYSLGYDIGNDLRLVDIELRPEAMVQGIQDALSGAEPAMRSDEIRVVLIELRHKIASVREEQRREVELEHLAKEIEFLEANAKRAGVVVTDSGLQYEIVKEGSGKTPGPTDQVTVNYRGTLVNGKEFDSSYERGEPATFQLDSVIKGWTEGLQHIKEGGRIMLFVPAQLAYGEKGLLANRTLVFDVELISVDEQE